MFLYECETVLDEYYIFEKNCSLIYLPVNGAAVIFLLNYTQFKRFHL